MLNPIRYPKSTLPLFAATAVMLGMSGCLSNDERSSNLGSSEGEAIATMENRLKDSAKVNQIVTKLDLALRPVANILSDVEKILKADEKEQIREKISQIKKLSITVVQKELEKMKNGLVKTNADGQWSVEKAVEWPFERDTIPGYTKASCGSSYISLVGEPAANQSQNVDLYLSDCALPRSANLLHANISENLDIQAEVNLGGIEEVLKPGGSKGPCSVSSINGVTQFECAPFAESTSGLYFEFEKISYYGTKAGEVLDFSLKISELNSDGFKPIARATVHKSVGQKTKVDLNRL